jgi:hypothetical protein
MHYPLPLKTGAEPTSMQQGELSVRPSVASLLVPVRSLSRLRLSMHRCARSKQQCAL